MPVYTYRCENCGHQFDKHQGFSDQPMMVCPKCHKHTLQKVYRPAGVVFKGSGFYVTDKKQKASAPNGSGTAKKPKENSAGESKTEGKAESKTENKTETKSEKSKLKPKSEDK